MPDSPHDAGRQRVSGRLVAERPLGCFAGAASNLPRARQVPLQVGANARLLSHKSEQRQAICVDVRQRRCVGRARDHALYAVRTESECVQRLRGPRITRPYDGRDQVSGLSARDFPVLAKSVVRFANPVAEQLQDRSVIERFLPPSDPQVGRLLLGNIPG